MAATINKRTSSKKQGRTINHDNEERQQQQQHHQQLWSRDPKKNKTDWTLHLRLLDSGNTETFHVHTHVLERISPRRVPYFEKIFKDNMTQIGKRESAVAISDRAAKKFAVLLDYLYCQTENEEKDFLLNVKNGMALYRIAEYYEIQPLQDMISTFYQESTLATNVAEFIDEPEETAEMLDDSALEKFAQSMHTVEYVQEEHLEPEYLQKALKRRNELKVPTSQLESENISCLVALCTKHYEHLLTRSLFYNITKNEYIPSIDQEAALQLLTIEAELDFWSDDDKFSSIQGRCIRALLSDWAGLREKFESDEAYWRTLRKMSSSILGILLMHSTGTAHGQDETNTEIHELQTVLST